MQLGALEVFNTLPGCLNLYHKKVINENIFKFGVRTLIASVRIAAMTSSDPPRTRLPSSDGSYSQIAVAFSTTAIFVIFFITSTFARLMTCPRHLDQISKKDKKRSMNKTHGSCNSLPSHFGSPRWVRIFSMVWQVVVLLLVLSNVAV